MKREDWDFPMPASWTRSQGEWEYFCVRRRHLHDPDIDCRRELFIELARQLGIVVCRKSVPLRKYWEKSHGRANESQMSLFPLPTACYSSSNDWRANTMNRIEVTGKLGNDAESRVTTAGRTIWKLSVADSYKVKGEYQTQWFKVAVFDGTDAMKSFAKGALVTVSGRFSLNKWTDKEGVERSELSIIADEKDIKLKEATHSLPPQRPAPSGGPDEGDDGVPF